jgi:hypothetical protein
VSRFRPLRTPLAAVLVAAAAVTGVAAAGVGPAAAVTSVPHSAAQVPAGLTGDAAGVVPRVFTGGLLGPRHTSKAQENFSSAAVGYLEGGSTPYVAAGYVDGTVHVWNALTGRQKFAVNTGAGAIEASVAMVSVDGHTDILGANEHGDVFMYNGAGRRVFHERMAARCPTCLRGGFATPTIAYLDANSTPFVVESGWDMHLWAWNARTGKLAPGFPVYLRDTSWSSPAIAYLTGSKYPDIIVGFDCGGARTQRCWPRQGGYVGAFNHVGKMLAGWPYFVNGETVWSSPAVVRLIPGRGEDVVVGTGLFPYPAHPNAGREVIALNSRGRPLPGWPVRVNSKVFSSPAVGSVTGSSTLDVAVTSQDGQTYLINATGHIRWERCAATIKGGCSSAHSSPVIANVMGGRLPQVITAASNSWRVLNSAGTDVLGGQIPATAAGLSAAPTVTQIGGRAALFFTLLAKDGPNARIREVVEYLLPHPLGVSPWPAFKQNMSRSGSAHN